MAGYSFHENGYNRQKYKKKDLGNNYPEIIIFHNKIP